MQNTDGLHQIDAMRQGVEYKFPIKVRGFELMVRPLSLLESNRIAQKVAESMKALPESARNRLTEHTYLAMFTLETASTSDVDSNDPKITQYVLERMTNDEVMAVFKQYASIVERCDPALEFLTQPEIDGLVAELKKNKSEYPAEAWDSQLIELSFLQLASLVRSLVTNDD